MAATDVAMGTDGAQNSTGSATEDPRESLRVLPRFAQYPLTVFTGKPLAGQEPLRWSPTYHLASAVAAMAIGAFISASGWGLGGWWLLLLLPGWAITLHGMRNLRMMVYHQCSHRNMYRRRKLDTLIGRATSSLLIIQNFERYSREHVSDHHAAHHMTLRDPTVQAFLVSLDMHPGMSRRQMWRRLLGKLVSPRFHFAFAVSRVRSFWSQSARSEKVTAILLYGTAAVAAGWTGVWAGLLVVWLVPLVPLFQVSNTLRLCVKHTFPAAGTEVRRGREYFASLTNAIFIGEAAPPASLPTGRRLLAWCRWGVRMLFIHAPSRYLVLTGDTVVHDYHHRYPSSRQWFNYIFARQQDDDSGHPGWPEYRAVWGLVPAISFVFDSLACADREEYDVNRLRSVSKRELFAAFDD
ncbi:fatty acid desaturase [Streptomyces olivaceiscleroticus]|uniref:Fatty acid desaturase domain-containing protein n=1 Tax=Streptomyces olivaceiscleroticus TaxID=68245 RepID=A0ABN1B870_9ACTN